MAHPQCPRCYDTLSALKPVAAAMCGTVTDLHEVCSVCYSALEKELVEFLKQKSNKPDDGGSMFPIVQTADCVASLDGATVRTYAAVHIFSGMLGNATADMDCLNADTHLASRAVRFADALIARLKREPGESKESEKPAKPSKPAKPFELFFEVWNPTRRQWENYAAHEVPADVMQAAHNGKRGEYKATNRLHFRISDSPNLSVHTEPGGLVDKAKTEFMEMLVREGLLIFRRLTYPNSPEGENYVVSEIIKQYLADRGITVTEF